MTEMQRPRPILTIKSDLHRARAWLSRNGRNVFLGSDAKACYATWAGASYLLIEHPSLRAAASDLHRYEVTAGLALVSVTVAVMSFMSGLMTKGMAKAIDDSIGVRALTETTQAMATVGALTIATAGAGLVLPVGSPAVETWMVITARVVPLGLSVWIVVGMLDLISLLAQFVRGKARLEQMELDAELAVKKAKAAERLETLRQHRNSGDS